MHLIESRSPEPDDGTIDFLRAIEWFEPCPACWKPIDIIAMADGIGGIENRRGKMAVDHACPHCGAELRVCYDVKDRMDFPRGP